MKPVFLTLSEHSLATFSVLPEHPELLRSAALRLCESGVDRWSVGNFQDSEMHSAVQFSAKRRGEQVDISVQTWYYVGFDWLIPGMLGVHVLPKLDKEYKHIDILGMLREVVTEPENLDYLDGLFWMDFKQLTKIDTQDSAGLRLFVATAYLNVLERIVRKGLMHSFYSYDEIFRRKIKGRVLFSQTIAGRHTPYLSDRLCCRQQEFGVNVPINQVLKSALRLVLRFLQTKALTYTETGALVEKARILLRAFLPVSDKTVLSRDVENLSNTVNPFFRDYREALSLSQKILELETLGCADTADRGSIPVHWINMPKLFELYVYAKLRKNIKLGGRIYYQFGSNWQYPDFLCKLNRDEQCKNVPSFFIADAKYKPRYGEGNSFIVDDARQLSGYARLSGVLDEFHRWGRFDRDSILPCVIIYSDQNEQSEELDWARLGAIPRWEKFYKIGIRLPEVSEEH